MNRPGLVSLTVPVPLHLHGRMRLVAEAQGVTCAQIIRDAISDRVEYMEAKLRAEEEKLRLAEEAAGKQKLAPGPYRDALRKDASAGRLDGDKAAARALPPSAVTTASDPPPDKFQAIYEKHGRLFAEATRPAERRLAVMEAITAAAGIAPLSRPSDAEITLALERVAARIEAAKVAGPPPPPVAPPAEVVDTSKIVTHGDMMDA